MIKIGDIVSRNKYNNDYLFKVTDIIDNTYYLSGVNIRLCVTSSLEDLRKENITRINEDEDIDIKPVEYRDEYFYLPGKILHIDADEDYLRRCLKYYKKVGLNAYGVLENAESEL